MRNDPVNLTDPSGNFWIYAEFLNHSLGIAASIASRPADLFDLFERLIRSSLSLPPLLGTGGQCGWAGCTTQQAMRGIFGPVVQQGIARARAQAALIIDVVTNPIGTARTIVESILNPQVHRIYHGDDAGGREVQEASWLKGLWTVAGQIAKRLAARKAAREAREQAVKGLRKQLEAHRRKLEDYLRDPDAYDNKDILKNAPSQEVRDRIIEGRARNLERQIENFQKQIDAILHAGDP